MKEHRFNYDPENDVLYIQNAVKDVEESVEFSEEIVWDLDKDGNVIGVEIFDASEFLNVFNKDKEFLKNLNEAYVEYKDFRNMRFVILMFESKDKKISQPLPPLRRSEYVSPLVISS